MKVTLTLGERMVVTRMRMGLNQDELAALLGCVRKTVYRAEHGHKVGKGVVARFEILEARQKHRGAERAEGNGGRWDLNRPRLRVK